MWQKPKYFCFTSLNRLLKTVEKVDDLSNSDKVKSTVTGLESQMGLWDDEILILWGILLDTTISTLLAQHSYKVTVYAELLYWGI